MKKLIFTAVLALVAGFAWSDETIALVKNEIHTVKVPFGIRSYTPSDKSVVRIEKIDDTTLRLTAVKGGRCDLEVRGDMDTVQKFRIDVGTDLEKISQSLQEELEQIPSLSCRVINNSIRIDGDVSKTDDWEYLQNVIKAYPAVRNFARFWPGPDLLAKFREKFEKAGFKCEYTHFDGERDTWPMGTVAMGVSKSNRMITFQARVFKPEQKDMLVKILNSERWMNTETDVKKLDAEKDAGKVGAMYEIAIAKPIIRISYAYMAISENEAKQLGDRLKGEGISAAPVFQTICDLIHGNNTGRRAEIGFGLTSFIQFLAENSFSRASDQAFTAMESWDPEGAQFKSGGTIYVPNVSKSAQVSVGTSEMKEIPYGMTIKTKGGLVAEDRAEFALDMEISSVTYDSLENIDKKEESTRQKITCRLGRTTFLAGANRLFESKGNKGFPGLRNVPVLSWFCSGDDKEAQNRRLILMVCPEIVPADCEDVIDNGKIINTAVDAKKPVKVLEEEAREEKGFWSSLFDWD